MGDAVGKAVAKRASEWAKAVAKDVPLPASFSRSTASSVAKPTSVVIQP